MNKQELRRAVRLRNGIPDTGDGLAGHTDIDDCLRAALLDLSAEKEWPWLLASTAVTIDAGTDVPNAALPSFTMIHKLVLNGKPAQHVSLAEFIDGTRTCVWTEMGNTIEVSPAPTVTLTGTLYYFRAEPTLDTDVATPLIPESFHQTVVARASYHLNARRGMNTETARDLAEYERGLPNIMRAAERVLGPRRVRDAYSVRGTWARWS